MPPIRSPLQNRTVAHWENHNRQEARDQDELNQCSEPTCHRIFEDRNAMLRHAHHDHGIVRPKFPCLFEQCTITSFSNVESCYDHMRSVHDYTRSFDKYESQASKQAHDKFFLCLYQSCNLYFRSKKHCHDHMKTAHRFPHDLLVCSKLLDRQRLMKKQAQ